MSGQVKRRKFKEQVSNYCLYSIFYFFVKTLKGLKATLKKPSIWSTLKLLRRKVRFSFSFSFFFFMDCLITLINRIPLCCWSSDFDTLWRRKRNARFLQDFFSCFFLLFKDFPVFQFFSLFFTVSPVFFVFFFCFFFFQVKILNFQVFPYTELL